MSRVLQYLDVIRMTGTVRVPIMTILCHVFHMGNIDGNTSRFFFWSIINFIIPFGFGHGFLSKH